MWRLYTYDVWGNAKDGWEVNNVFRTSTTADPSVGIDASDRAIREAFGMEKTVDLEGSEDTIYLTNMRDGKPLGKLRWEEKES